MKVQDLMTRDVATCAPHDDLANVARLMWDHDCGSVPVVDSSLRVLGMLTDRDVCMCAWSKGQPLAQLCATDAMSKHLVACGAGDEVTNALALMRERQVRRLPVTDARGRLVGLLSLNDAARAAASKEVRATRELPLDTVASTLSAICEPHCALVPATARRGEPLAARQADIEC